MPDQAHPDTKKEAEFDPSFLPPVPFASGERKFTAKNGQSFMLALKISGGGEVDLLIAEEVQDKIQLYGEGSDNPIYTPGSEPVKVSKTLAYFVARLVIAEVPPAAASVGWEKRSFAWWATLAQRDKKTWAEVLAFYSELESAIEGDEGDPLKND